MTSTLDAVMAQCDRQYEAAEARLFDWSRIPSVSVQPLHAIDCRRAAEWVRDQLLGLGFTAGLHPIPGHRVVLAHYPRPSEGGRICCSTAIITCSRRIRWKSGSAHPSTRRRCRGRTARG